MGRAAHQDRLEHRELKRDRVLLSDHRDSPRQLAPIVVRYRLAQKFDRSSQGAIVRASSFSSVDLPAPLGPTIATSSPKPASRRSGAAPGGPPYPAGGRTRSRERQRPDFPAGGFTIGRAAALVPQQIDEEGSAAQRGNRADRKLGRRDNRAREQVRRDHERGAGRERGRQAAGDGPARARAGSYAARSARQTRLCR